MKTGPRRILATAVFLTLALGPVSGSSAKVSWECPPGTSDHHYCIKTVDCKKRGVQQHDCRKDDN